MVVALPLLELCNSNSSERNMNYTGQYVTWTGRELEPVRFKAVRCYPMLFPNLDT